MTLEEAIEHCKEVAKERREAALSYARENAYETAISCKAVGYEHEQIAEWLIELKQRREAENSEKPKSNGDHIRNMLTDEYIVKNCFCIFYDECCDCPLCDFEDCNDIQTRLEWLKQEVSEDD